MSNEKHDEFSSWRSLLGSQDALPEHGLDSRDRTWEKLTHRLRPQPAVRRRNLVYWVAAACFLLVLVPAILFVGSGRQISAPTAADPGRVQAPSVPPSRYPVEGDIVFRSGAVKPHSRPLRRQMARPTVPPKPAPATPPIVEVPIEQPPVATLQNLPMGGADSIHKTLTIKELRIVHINEIGNSNHSEPAVTSSDKRNGAPDIRAVIILKTRQ